MIKISTARQIVSDIHMVFPEGLRKAVRKDLAENIHQRHGFYQCAGDSLRFLGQNASEFKRLLLLNYPVEVLNNLYGGGKSKAYCASLCEKELNKLMQKSLKENKVRINNMSANELGPEIIYDIWEGLMITKKAGLKLPERVNFKNLMDCDGSFNIFKPKKIYIDSNCRRIRKTTIHETIHKNDFIAIILNRFTGITIFTKLLVRTHKKTIGKELCEYAYKNRNEFIACSAEKILTDGKSWSALDPKIRRLYKILLGPKLKLD